MASRHSKPLIVFVSVGVPFLLYILHAYVLKGWIVDDAGISFVFSRNLAAGYGLVAQPGVSPVECYSNFAWVALFTPFFAFHAFDPLLTPKIVSALLVLLSFILLGQAFRYLSAQGWLASFVVTLFAAANTSFLVWTSSGLENPLYVLGLVSLLLIVCSSIKSPAFSIWNGVGMGLVCALIALTRPEGVLYIFLVPFFFILILGGKKGLRWQTWASRGLLFALSFGCVYGGYLLFRWQYFGVFFPNTYYAKGGPSLDSLKAILLLSPEVYSKFAGLNGSVANKAGSLLSVSMLVAWLGLIFRGKVTRTHLALLSLYGTSVLAYLLLSADWMGEFRFATPAVLFFYACLYLASEIWLSSLVTHERARLTVAFLGIALLLLLSGRIFYHRTQTFARNPTVPFSNVVNDLGLPFNEAAHKLGLGDGSLLIPDMGGTLYVSNLRVYDLGGLCDATIAQTRNKDQAAFYDYVFEVARPTFIHTHFPWAQLANLDADPRFRQDYLPIRETFDEQNQVYQGDYVRKEVVTGREDLLPTLFADGDGG